MAGSNNAWYYSFEFFPPKTEAGLDNLLTRIDRMSNRMEPLFIDVTWGASGSTSAQSLFLASHAQRYCGVDVLLHLTCAGMTRDNLDTVLRQAKSCGVQNILALRGDCPTGKLSWEEGGVSGGHCDRAIDLVRLIRDRYGDYFGIAVAGHPEGHPASYNWRDEIRHLKEKIDAGADFIITQFFYDVDLFLTYVKRCRHYGILCPILPGIMPIQSYSSFHRMTKFCNISVPPAVLHMLEPVKHDDEAVKEIGCRIASDMSTRILSAAPEDGGVDGIHFYTLNLERSVTRILMTMGAFNDFDDCDASVSHNGVKPTDRDRQERAGLLPNNDTLKLSGSSSLVPLSRRHLPWRQSAMESRIKEDVRPINWANRPKSYVMRTEDWDEFPNGRWGDSSSPAFGELSNLSHFYSFSLPRQLAALNRAGFLTVNSQPPVDGVKSSHPVFGWGGAGGFVYQKAYCECFVSPENVRRLVEMVAERPRMNLYAVDNSGRELREGVEEGGVTALTWGVFPNREVLQPTIFDSGIFLVWAEEAFSLWTSMWLNLYEMDSKSYELIETIRDTYYPVAIIDNDFTAASEDGNSWSCCMAGIFTICALINLIENQFFFKKKKPSTQILRRMKLRMQRQSRW